MIFQWVTYSREEKNIEYNQRRTGRSRRWTSVEWQMIDFKHNEIYKISNDFNDFKFSAETIRNGALPENCLIDKLSFNLDLLFKNRFDVLLNKYRIISIRTKI